MSFREPFASFFSNGWVTLGNTKISKRAGGAVGPDEFVERYGADAVRMCILFLGPANEDMEWTGGGGRGHVPLHPPALAGRPRGSGGAPQGAPENGPLARKAHPVIAKATDDIGRRYAFNTAISAVMELVNELSKDTSGRTRASRQRRPYR